jgi:hypothetical protein
MFNLSFKHVLIVLADRGGGHAEQHTALLRQIQLVALYQSALGAAEFQTYFTDGATTSWFA